MVKQLCIGPNWLCDTTLGMNACLPCLTVVARAVWDCLRPHIRGGVGEGGVGGVWWGGVGWGGVGLGYSNSIK